MAKGAQIVLRALHKPEVAVRDEKMPPAAPGERLDPSVQHARHAASERAHPEGGSEGSRHRLVLDFVPISHRGTAGT